MRFSKKEFHSFVTASTDKARVMWLALSGEILTAKESAELTELLTEFFSKRPICKSLRKYGLGKGTS